MNDVSPDNTAAQDAVYSATSLAIEGKVEQAIEIFELNLKLLSEGTIADRRVAASAFSYYGLCVAKVRRRYAEGVKYCQISLRSNPLDPDHRANLAMVYLERDDRPKAVEALNAGLRLDSRNRRINRVLDIIGRRRPPVIPFLSRNNPLNIWLGKKRATNH
jgi:tetratricopeptide (TPR) repeat protein